MVTTILASRGKDNRPSDLEFGLRSYCQKVIVKGKPLSGAHLLFTSERMAIRAYYPCDLIELEQQEESQTTVENSNSKNKKKEGEEGDDKDNFDGLSSFFKSFQLALVLFVLPPSTKNNNNTVMKQLGDESSYFHRAQRLAGRLEDKAAASNNNNRNLRVMIFSNTQLTIDFLISVSNAITPERKEGKRIFLQRLEKGNFLPNPNEEYSNSNEAATEAETAAAAVHVAEGIRKLGEIFELPEGEVNILMSELKDLRTIVTADDSTLDTIPIEERTRRVLHSFFGSTGRRREGLPSQRITNNMTVAAAAATATATHVFRPQSLSLPPQSSSSFMTPNPHRSFQSQEATNYQMRQQQQQLQVYDDLDNDDQNRINNFWAEPTSNLDPISSFFQGGEDEIPDTDDNININTNNGDDIGSAATIHPQRSSLSSSSQVPSVRGPTFGTSHPPRQFSVANHPPVMDNNNVPYGAPPYGIPSTLQNEVPFKKIRQPEHHSQFQYQRYQHQHQHQYQYQPQYQQQDQPQRQQHHHQQQQQYQQYPHQQHQQQYQQQQQQHSYQQYPYQHSQSQHSYRTPLDMVQGGFSIGSSSRSIPHHQCRSRTSYQPRSAVHSRSLPNNYNRSRQGNIHGGTTSINGVQQQRQQTQQQQRNNFSFSRSSQR